MVWVLPGWALVLARDFRFIRPLIREDFPTLLFPANENVKAQWGKMIEDYLHKSKQLKLVFLLIDIRHAPSENDRIMYDWIRRNGYDPIIIATKLDKINRSQIQKQIKLIRTTLQAGADTQIIPYSAQTKQGREEIYEILDGVLAAEDPAQE
jgi:GTP-binding protein